MRIPSFAACLAVFACACLSGCATPPKAERESNIELPLASVHSDLTFILTTGTRQNSACPEVAVCALWHEDGESRATAFASQVRRLAGALQDGASRRYPDLAARVPALGRGGFDVYVVAGDGPGASSSAGGRIALNAALGARRPTDDWLAFVIAREMGHVIAGHHGENSTASIATSVLMNFLIPGSGLLKSAASTVGSQFAAGRKREQQAREADTIALDLLGAAGFRLRDVALSLVIAPSGGDDDAWAQEFRKSSDKLVTDIRGRKIQNVSKARDPVS